MRSDRSTADDSAEKYRPCASSDRPSARASGPSPDSSTSGREVPAPGRVQGDPAAAAEAFRRFVRDLHQPRVCAASGRQEAVEAVVAAQDGPAHRAAAQAAEAADLVDLAAAR